MPLLIFIYNMNCDWAVVMQILAFLIKSQRASSDTQVTVKACGPLFFYSVLNKFMNTYTVIFQSVVFFTILKNVNEFKFFACC